MKQEDCFQWGYVIKHHGVNGAVNIFLDVDEPEKYMDVESVLVEINQNLVPFFISRLEVRDKKAILKLEGIDDVEGAHALKSCRLFLPLHALPKLAKGQFYYHDIIGFAIQDEKYGPLGQVKAVYYKTGQDLIAMSYKNKEVLIPVTDDIVKSTDPDLHILNVNLPDGLIDIYLNP